MASERPGSSTCWAAHLSTAARICVDSRIAVTGSCPVAGLPGLFRTTFLVDDVIIFALRLLSLKNKRPADAFEATTGLAQTMRYVMAQVVSENSTAMPVVSTRRRFLATTATLAAGGTALAAAVNITAARAAAEPDPIWPERFPVPRASARCFWDWFRVSNTARYGRESLGY